VQEIFIDFTVIWLLMELVYFA